MSMFLRRALAGALSASMALTPCAAAFAQKKDDKPAKADKKADKKADTADAKADKPKGKRKNPPTKAERDKAKAAFGRGKEKFEAGDYAAAAEAYREANETIPSPQALYRYALALDKAGKGAEARAQYQLFLDVPPPEAMAEQKGAAETRLKELNVGTIKLTSTPDGASVMVDGQPAAGPTPLTLTLKPGPHTLEVKAPNYEPSTRELVVVAASSVDVAVPLKELPPTPPPAPTAPPPPPPEPVASASVAPPPKEEAPPSKVPAYVTLGLAGAGAVVGTIFGIKALSAKSDFKDSPTTSNADSAERNALIADMAFGVALTLGITGTVLLLSGNKKEPAKAGSLRLYPVLGPQSQGAAAVLRF